MGGADGGKTWSEIEAEPNPWGHPKDYNSMFELFGLHSPSLCVFDRWDVRKAHANILTHEEVAKASGFVSTDVNMIFVKPTDLPAGQYYRSTSETGIQHFADVQSCPGNVGGFHGCVTDTEDPGSKWHLLARFADVGKIFGSEMGGRPTMAILAHHDLLIGTKPTKTDGRGIEMRALTKITDIHLPAATSRVLFSDICQDWTGRLPRFMLEMIQQNHPGVVSMTCVGDGYFPVFVGRDARGRIRKITVLFPYAGFDEDVLLRVASADQAVE